MTGLGGEAVGGAPEHSQRQERLPRGRYLGRAGAPSLLPYRMPAIYDATLKWLANAGRHELGT